MAQRQTVAWRLARGAFGARWFFLSLLLVGRAATALEPSQLLSQYAHTVWRIQDGDLPGTVFPMGQTTDGYLWIGWQSGALRFDGARFVAASELTNARVPNRMIVSILGAKNGDLWIGSVAGLTRWRDGVTFDYAGVPGGARSLIEDEQHRIWFVTVANDGAALCEIRDDNILCHGKADGLDLPKACCYMMASDGRGNFAISTQDGIVRWRPGSQSSAFTFQSKAAGGLTGTATAVYEATGQLLVGVPDPGHGLGLQRLLESQSQDVMLGDLDGSTLSVQFLFRDRENALWIGTVDRGLFRFANNRVDHFGSNDGLSSDYVQAIFEDRDGSIWVTTSQGLDRFRQLRVVSFTKREGINTDEVDSVLATHDGKVWIGTPYTLDVLDHDHVHSIGADEGKPGLQVTTLLEDAAARLWVGIDNMLTIYAHGKFTAIPSQSGQPFGFVTGLAQENNGDIWAAVKTQPRKLVHLRGDRVMEEFIDPAVPPVASMAADPKGGIWLGLVNGDLMYLQSGIENVFHSDDAHGSIRHLVVAANGNIFGATTGLLARTDHGVHRITMAQGLPCEDSAGLIEDDRQTIWLQTACGLVTIAETEIEHAVADTHYVMHVDVLDVFDGVRAGCAPFNTAARTPDGRLWFANGFSLQTLDPGRPYDIRIPPTHILQLTADRRPYPVDSQPRLPALTRDLQFDYTAPELAVPQRLRFRYRLDGHDAEWIDAGNRRQAFYTDLAPGSYRFDVSASEDGKSWSPTPATLPLLVLPAFYQTGWFAAIVVIVAGVLLWIAFAWQMRQMHVRIRARMEAQLSERERIARELHDTFLQCVQALMLRFQSAMEKIPPTQPARELMESALDQADAVLIDGRERVSQLRSLHRTRATLPTLLEDLGNSHARETSVAFAITVEGNARELDAEVCDELRHIASEALINAFRHAHGTRVDLTITYATRALKLQIVDNGCGFNMSTAGIAETSGHWGLRGMRERAKVLNAELKISSGANIGTAIEITVPASIIYRNASNPLRRWFGS